MTNISGPKRAARITSATTARVPAKMRVSTNSNSRTQHAEPCVSRGSVADETKISDLLHRKPEGADVGSLESRWFAPAAATIADYRSVGAAINEPGNEHDEWSEQNAGFRGSAPLSGSTHLK